MLARPPSSLFPSAASAVEIESRLLVSETVTDAANDKEQLEPTLATTSSVIESIAAVLIDSGFYSAACSPVHQPPLFPSATSAVAGVERGSESQPGPLVYAATGRPPHGRSIETLEKRADPPAPEPGASAAAVMAHRLSSKAGRTLYALRKQTIEPPCLGSSKQRWGLNASACAGWAKCAPNGHW